MVTEGHTDRELRKIIRKQMQFYFSDANLNRDNFMRKAISSSEDDFIPLAEFTKFNKIRLLTSDIQLIARAVKKSKQLELNEDKTAVKRKLPMKDIENVDDRTVYTEFLPPDATHEWLSDVFSVCGNVSYVSLPRYQSSGDIKQFAFIEYTTPAEADEACRKLNNPPDHAPEKIGKFPAWNKKLFALTQQVNAIATEADHSNELNHKKRSHTGHGEDGMVGAKRRKDDDSSCSDSDMEEDSPNRMDDSELPRLRVIHKLEWLKLKHEYISLQKTSMAKLKKTLNRVPGDDEKTSCSSESQEAMQITGEKKLSKVPKSPQYVPDVIVKIESTTSLTKQELRNIYGAKCNIEYVDMNDENDNVAIVRCKDSFSADMMINGDKEGINCALLQGEEERKYWEKVRESQLNRYNRNTDRKKKKQRKNKAVLHNKKTVFPDDQ